MSSRRRVVGAVQMTGWGARTGMPVRVRGRLGDDAGLDALAACVDWVGARCHVIALQCKRDVGAAMQTGELGCVSGKDARLGTEDGVGGCAGTYGPTSRGTMPGGVRVLGGCALLSHRAAVRVGRRQAS